MIGLPGEAGSVQPTVTVSLALPAAVTWVGAYGTLGAVIADDGCEGSLVPLALVAVTVKT